MQGSERDLLPEQRTGRKAQYDDPDVCKYYLCGLDVNMFKNTRSNDDLQRHISPEDFAKIQSDDLRADFNALSSPERAKSGYEMQTKRLLDVLIRECDSRIARQNARCEEMNANAAELKPEQKQIIDKYNSQISEYAAKAEKLGEDGEVDAAQQALAESDRLKVLRDEAETRFGNVKQMFACAVSGVLMSSVDNEERKIEHETGKQYVGWKLLRELRDELSEKIAGYAQAGHLTAPHAAPRPDGTFERGAPMGGWGRGGGGGRSNRHSDGRGHRDSRPPFSGRDHGRDHRDRDRDRDKDRDRRRDGSRGRRDRSRDDGRDRDGRDRSRDRHRDRDRDRDRDRTGTAIGIETETAIRIGIAIGTGSGDAIAVGAGAGAGAGAATGRRTGAGAGAATGRRTGAGPRIPETRGGTERLKYDPRSPPR